MIYIQILKSLSKVISSKEGSTDAYCITNSTRPLLCLGQRGTKGGRKTMLFVEALRKYEKEAKEANFEEAYKLALPIFKDRLQQTFIVLKDSVAGEKPPVATGANQVPVGSKRNAPDDLGSGSDPKRPAN